jgi:N-acetylmuramoyl-L-alanine amidase
MKSRTLAVPAIVIGALLADVRGYVPERLAAGRDATARLDRHTAVARDSAPVIVIDPGHPSEKGDGARGHGVAEVTAAWEVALRLRDSLAGAGYEVRMTKSAERQLVRNAERAHIANAAGAALMVRLHCDVGSGTGFTLYYPDRKGTAEGRTGPSEEVMTLSRAAALTLDTEMAALLSPAHLRDGGVRGDSRTFVGSQQGALTGSIFSEVPVVTVEMAVLTDRSDARFIGSPEGQVRMAGAITAGVRKFVPLPTGPAPAPPAPDAVPAHERETAKDSLHRPAPASPKRDSAATLPTVPDSSRHPSTSSGDRATGRHHRTARPAAIRHPSQPSGRTRSSPPR